MGVWGIDGEPISITCAQPIDKIEIIINAPSEEFLNIKSVEVFTKHNEDLIQSELFESAELSTNYFDDTEDKHNVTQRVIQHKMLHSKLEYKPHITLSFKQGVLVDRIVIHNRPGSCGHRSRFITINGSLHGETKLHYSNIEKYASTCELELSILLFFISKRDHLNNFQNKTVRKRLHTLLLRGSKKPFIKHIIKHIFINKIDFHTPAHTVYAQKYIRNLIYKVMQHGTFVSDELLYALLPCKETFPTLDNLSALYLSKLIYKKLLNRESVELKEIIGFNSLINNNVALTSFIEFANSYLTALYGYPVQLFITSKKQLTLNFFPRINSDHADFIHLLFDQISNINNVLPYLVVSSDDNNKVSKKSNVNVLIYFNDYHDKTLQEAVETLSNNLNNSYFSLNTLTENKQYVIESKQTQLKLQVIFAKPSNNKEYLEISDSKFDTSNLSQADFLQRSAINIKGKDYYYLITGLFSKNSAANKFHHWSSMIYPQNGMLCSKAIYNKREAERTDRLWIQRTQMVAWSQCIESDNRPPSNTLHMLKQALKHGYDVVELDLRATIDNNIVLAHDDVMKNKWGHEITLSKSSLEDAQKFVIDKFNEKNCYINSLNDALPLLKNKKILLDARLKPTDYVHLKRCLNSHNIKLNDLIFCVYNTAQLATLLQEFPESVLLWKFYTQLWEIDSLILKQLRVTGVDGVMYLYPHFNENFTNYFNHLQQIGLQSMCFVHGQQWTPKESSGLTDSLKQRTPDDYDKSLKMLTNMGVEYVTTTHYTSPVFNKIIS